MVSEHKKIRKALRYPESYPKHGTYGDLLTWHLKQHGTNPEGNTEDNGPPWVLIDFAILVHEERFPEKMASRNLSNWMKKDRAPPKNAFYAKRILEILFGDKEYFDDWRRDLQSRWEAYYASKAIQKNKKASSINENEVVASQPVSKTITSQSYSRWPGYTRRQLPKYLFEWGDLQQPAGQTVDRLMNFEFISGRYAVLGAWEAPRLMAAEWKAWYNTVGRKVAPLPVDAIRHMCFWNYYAVRLPSDKAVEFDDVWWELMHDAGLAPPVWHKSNRN